MRSDHETPPQIAAVVINPLVVDLSHHVADFGKVKAAGIAGIIHKATEAISITSTPSGAAPR